MVRTRANMLLPVAPSGTDSRCSRWHISASPSQVDQKRGGYFNACSSQEPTIEVQAAEELWPRRWQQECSPGATRSGIEPGPCTFKQCAPSNQVRVGIPHVQLVISELAG